MLCARVMRGISSMANSATPVLASAVEAVDIGEGIEHADQRRALLHGFDARAGWGRLTVSTMSASATASASVLAILAPAAL